MVTILCVATYLKGEPFLRQCKALGARVVLLTVDTLVHAAWPFDAIDEVHAVARSAGDADVRRTAAGIARRHRIDRIAALDDFDVETAAMLREFLQIPGLGRTAAARFRDKLTMRTSAQRLGIPEPAFSPVFTDADVDAWADRIAPPWVLKPRALAAASGIRTVHGRDGLRPALDALGDERPIFLLEQFVTGDVYHVDSIVRNGAVLFQVASKYRRPPMQIAHEGGVFVTRTLPPASPDAVLLLDIDRRLLTGFELENGVSHSEYIRSASGLVFLETSARVGGAYIVDVLEAATGVNLWREWARIELAGPEGAYAAPAARADSAGIALCLARQEQPDLSAYGDPEIVLRIPRPHHAGLIVRSADPRRVETLLESYVTRFGGDFLATMPAPDRPVA